MMHCFYEIGHMIIYSGIDIGFEISRAICYFSLKIKHVVADDATP